MMGDDVQGLSLATLVLLEGSSGLKDEVFKITTLRTTLGRDPSKTDISFYTDEESSVSRVHCIIVLDDDNVFRLIDKNSSSGTRLNGRQIKPEVAVDLAEGDEIVLGNLAQKGVKLRFNYMSGDDDVQLSGNADDRTHLLSDEDARNWDEMLDNSS
jgi:pSer/pThr/pTyr-binding forkhead associated (FHA) protein